MVKIGIYTIHDDLESLDTESERTNRKGWIEKWQSGENTFFCIKGDLPDYVTQKLYDIALARGYKHWLGRLDSNIPGDAW